MNYSGAKIIIETLIEQGVTTVFGYPGGQVVNIYDELYKNSDRITHILTSHEQGAAHAADGYARATGNVGVCFATSGPGATNLVTGIANAFLDSVPLVAITGNVPLALIGRDSFQEVDITGITMPITKHNYIVKDVSTLADTIREAFTIAKSGRPGPVLIDVPKDIQVAQCEFIKSQVAPKEPYPQINPKDIDEAIELIKGSKRPYIYSGGGVILSGAADELKKFADIIDAPVGFSMMGLSAMDNSDKRNLGMTGMHGKYASTKAMSEADLIIGIGVRFSDRATGNKSEFSKNNKIIHIDIDPAEISKNITAYNSVIGNIKDILKIFNQKLEKKENTQWQQEIFKMREYQRQHEENLNGLTARKIIENVKNYTKDDTIIVTDVGQHQMWTAQYYKFVKPRTFLTSGGLGTMGYGLGAAVGACVAADNKKTVLFTGDGSFHMNINELATAVTNDLNIVIVVMNNGVLGMVRQWQNLFFEKHFSNTTLNRKTDFVKVAEGFGAKGYRVENPDELDGVLKKAFSDSGPVVVECKVDKEDMVFPMIPPGGSISDMILSIR